MVRIGLVRYDSWFESEGLSVWTLHFLPLSVRVFPIYHENMHYGIDLRLYIACRCE